MDSFTRIYDFGQEIAVEPLRESSAVFGHSAISVTDRHYAHWVRALQKQLKAEVRRIWDANQVGA